MKFEALYQTWDEPKANMIKALLEDNEIECYLSSPASRTVHPFNVDGLGEIKIMVPTDKEFEARQLVTEHFDLN